MRHYIRQAMFIGVLVIFPLMATAQISLGVRGGPLFSKPTIGESSVSSHLSVRSMTGFSVGAVVQVRMTEKVALVFEPGFVRKGLDMVPEPNQLFSERVFGLDYVELPVNLKMTFTRGAVQPFVTLGSALAYKVSESWTIKTGSTEQPADQPDVFARYDVTALLGGGLSVAIADPIAFVIDGRYSFGLNYIEETGAARIRSAEWRLGAGMLLRF